MELVDAVKAGIHNAIDKQLEALEQQFTEKLTNQLSERDKTFALERLGYVEENEILRKEAAKVESLEAENAKLRAELDVATTTRCPSHTTKEPDDHAKHSENQFTTPLSKPATSTITLEEYNRVQESLAKSNREYERIVFAHSILQSRVRQYKDMTRQWRAYVKDWVLRHPSREPKPPAHYDPEPARNHEASSAPTPPALPEGTTPSISSLSRSSSPQQPRHKTLDIFQNQQEEPPTGPQSKNLIALTDDIISTQIALDLVHPESGSDGLTQSPDESEGRSSTANGPHMVQSRNLECEEITLYPTSTVDNGGSSPIIISERSLKRKRPTSHADIGVHVHADGRGAFDASKRPAIKDETTSSSPLPVDHLFRTGEPHDSIDLDDVGDHLTTPRKRHRMELQRLRSSILAPPRTLDEEEKMLNELGRLKHIGSGPANVKDEDQSQASHKYLACTREAAMNVQTTQNDEKDQAEIAKAEKKALLREHNDRVVGRREIADQSPSGSNRIRGIHSKLIGKVSTVGPPESPIIHNYPTLVTEGHAWFSTPQGRRENNQREADLTSPVILRPVDLNIHTLPRTSDGLASHKRSCPSSRLDRGAAAVPALAEDGENPDASHKWNRSEARPKKEQKASDAHQRLGALLRGPSPAKASPPLPLVEERNTLRGAASTGTPLAQTMPHSRYPTTPGSLPSMKTVPSGVTTSMNPPMTEGSTRAAKPVFRKPFPIDGPQDTKPEHEPLRARPLHRLRLEDFKLNPAHSNFAYHESVRKHDEKKALSGCTTAHCLRCKDVRKFVESSDYADLPGQDRDEVDQRLIENFLGNDKRRIKSLSEKERQDILTEAKLQQFADKFSRHRTAFGRSKSPVGFWDVGFPSTQEGEENREAARVMVREKVEERYWEAIRKGGRWIFADE